MAFLFPYAKADEKPSRVNDYYYCKIVCNLDMVRLYLHAEGKGEKRRAEQRLGEPFFPCSPSGKC